KQYPLQARRVMHAVWGAGQMSWTKSVFVVDDDVDVHDTERVLAAAAARCEPSRDIERVRGPLDILDHAAPWLGAGTKFGLDCTRKVEGEQAGSRAALVERAGIDSGAAERLLQACRTVEGVRDVAWHAGGWLLVRVEKPRAGAGRAAGEALARLWRNERSLPAPAFVVLLGDEVDVRNFDSALFHWLAHSDAGRDAWVVPPGDGATGEGGTWMIDATPKLPGDERLSGGECEPVRPWPPYLRVDGELSARARRLLESGPGSRRS
ncbi:MAG TPA: UbiD family decarboxylase, partial [Phycisphaerales bacterium]|nr:UbiD family decarboxylase [Phycisphaerales bacterium]